MIRLLDIVLSTIALIALSPLLVPVMVVLRLTGEGEVFYAQERIGKGGKPFGVLKFATMLKNSPSIGSGTVTVKNDPRVLPVGRFLRKTKINELPQLINILKGDMSVIGPRPLVKSGFESYDKTTQAAVMSVRPGLSGIGSIIFRDEESLLEGKSDALNFHRTVIGKYKGKLESWFVKNYSFSVYIRAIFLTAWVVLFPKSRLVWKVFPTLPKPDGELARML